MRRSKYNGRAFLRGGRRCRVLIRDGRIMDSDYITCVWAGSEKFHDWFVRCAQVRWFVPLEVERPAKGVWN